jgi:hypothetical protein
MLMMKFLGLLAGLALAASAAQPAKITDVVMEPYGGWSEALVMRGGDCKAAVVPGIGGRVMSYAVNGENLLFENPEAWGRTLATASNGFWVGGYQCDLGPELRGIPEHKALWNGPWLWRLPRPYTVQVVSEPFLALGVQMEKELVIDPDTGDLGVTQRLRNVISNDVSFCLWDRTLCKGGGFVLIPLNKRSAFKAGWSIRRGQSGSYSYEGNRPADARVRVIDGVLVAQARALPEAKELKLGTDSDAGWIAYVRGKTLFVKYFPVYAKANYSDGGNTVEFYCDDRVAELEPLSPEVTLKPGSNYSFPEKWTLIELADEVATFEKARAVVKQHIPSSPFAK